MKPVSQRVWLDNSISLHMGVWYESACAGSSYDNMSCTMHVIGVVCMMCVTCDRSSGLGVNPARNPKQQPRASRTKSFHMSVISPYSGGHCITRIQARSVIVQDWRDCFV